MKKRGLITFYIIIGLIILVLGLVIFYVAQNIEQPTSRNLRDQKGALQLQLQSCVQAMAKEYFIYFGAGGGASLFTFAPSEVDVGIPNWYLKGKNELPPLEEMIESADDIIARVIHPYCAEELDYRGFSIAVSEPVIKTTVKDIVSIKVDYPIVLQQGDQEITLDEFSVTLPLRIKHLHDITNQIIEHQREDPDFVDITFLNSFDVDIMYEPQDEHFTQVMLIDQRAGIGGEPYDFQFGMYFGEEDPTPNKIPWITTKQDSFSMEVGKQFVQEIKASDKDDDSLFFSVFPPFISIDPASGVINFTPDVEHAGTYAMIVTVSDNRNASFKQFNLTIE